MKLALAPQGGDAPDPIVQTARTLGEMLAAGRPLGRETLRELLTDATGRSDADGGWTLRDAYDALELAQVLLVAGPRSPIEDREPAATLDRLEKLARSLPTQSHRAEEQVALQAFSTPLPLAWLVGLAGHLSKTDVVLEPSAGTGLLAASAARAGCRLFVNEIDPGRRRCLAVAYPQAALSGHDGELIHDLLDPAVRPSVVLMNPPFARGAERGEDRYAGARHLLASLTRLAPGGRLIAMMPESFSDAGSGRALRAKADRLAGLRLDMLLSPGLFAKHGTGIAVRFLVYDKLHDGCTPIHGRADRLEQLLARIEKLPGRASTKLQPLPPRTGSLSLFARRTALSARPAALRAMAADRVSEPLAYRTLEDPAPVADQVGLYLPYRPSRGRPARVVRFRRGVIIAIAALGSLALIATAWLALKPATLSMIASGEDRPANAASAAPDVLAGAPRSYGDVPRLGPPLPGDLGRPILERQREMATETPLPGQPPAASMDAAAQAAETERQRRLAEARQAREARC